jgi:curved DNA-binding protein CbpA
MAPRTRIDRDYYRILEVDPGAGEEEIRKAYRRAALTWHPDRNPGNPEAEERFKAISEAYAVLIDASKRREYDRARQAGTPGDFRYAREDLFRDLFADPRASAIFEDLAREFERMGMRVDRHYFRQTLFGGRAVITGGVFIITPLTPVLALLRLAHAALRGAQGASLGRGSAAAPVGAAREPEALPAPPRGIRDRLVRAGRWLLGLPPGVAPSARGDAAPDVSVPLRLTLAEAERGARRRVVLPGNGGRDDEVLVTIPPGTRPGTRLRLRGRGRTGPDGRPGDTYLVVELTDA